jgi:hypothetical protein
MSRGFPHNPTQHTTHTHTHTHTHTRERNDLNFVACTEYLIVLTKGDRVRHIPWF